VSTSEALLPVWGAAGTATVMFVAWLRQRRTRNAGIVDVLWAFAIGALGVAYALAADGWIGRRLLVGGIVPVWSLRLGLHLAQRVAGEAEDGRYAAIRASKGKSADAWLFWFFQAQAALAVLLSLAVLVPATSTLPGFRAWDLAAVAVFAISITGETIADRQLAAWRKDPANRGRTCRVGLWAWSRHPNYFFEWLHWLAYPLIAVGLSGGAFVWLAPALLLFLILRVTGIPPTEERAVASRGDDYRDYQRTTNAFFPGPPDTRSVRHTS
jgi:steroid 5-alpha reductase family enzyme